ncbi:MULTISPECIES: hypothetical protein [Thalassospira]|uniref:Glycerophosphoryl diester phosphodiesterase membrane domain-containing protein n=2 Tax=Thalassospira TaxID=168934 RepID=A0A367VYW4_9PROT|nr:MULTISPECIES: hypothetical protein [Thalassospira]MDG4721782.1 hypothetical protein [Thalassospira sp. FZY0004]RCK31320.1 hypothetical protein TH19_21440 [Thalassospira profundimaris]
MSHNKASGRSFKSWIIQDACDVFWKNRFVVAVAIIWLVLFDVFDVIVPHPDLLGSDGVLSFAGACWFVLRALIDAFALILVGISAHLSCLVGRDGWGTIRAANRKAVLHCAAGMLGVAVLIIAAILAYQQFLVPDILRALLGGRNEASHPGRLLIGGLILIGLLGAIALGASWFAAVLSGAGSSVRATWWRGRVTFLFVIWRLVAVLLLLPVISALIVPVIGQMVAVFHVIGIPADAAVLVIPAIVGGMIACFVTVLLSVIFVRSFVISLK